MKIKNMTPNSDWILVNKTKNDHIRDKANGEIMLYLPESHVQTTSWAEVVDIGPKCRYFTKELCDGKTFVILPELSNKMRVIDIGDDNEFRFIRESIFLEKGPNRGFIYRDI